METYFKKQTNEELQLILKDTEGCTSIFIGMMRDLVESELKHREEKKRKEEEANKPKDKYNEMLYKLFLKGIIDEETLEKKMEERKKATEFEKDVEKAIYEVMEEGYVKKAVERISKEKLKRN